MRKHKDREFVKWQTYWYLTVIEPNEILNWKQKVLVRCKCWTEKYVLLNNLLATWSNRVFSCWCMRNELISKHHTTHWMWSSHWIYNTYRQMCSRCKNKNNKDYHRYWWRWIKVIRKSFEDFYKDMWTTYKEWLTIDRIDVNWNYCKENCRRADCNQQANNRRNNHKIIYKGIEYNLCELAKKFWVDHTWLARYIKKYPLNREEHYTIKYD